jgi:glycosyltransferase involved in cell wall biosynthesis
MYKKIVYVQYTNPTAYPPLEHSSRILADSGWTVIFLATKAFTANNIMFPYNPGIRIEYMSFCKPGIVQKFHYLIYWLWVYTKILLWRPEYVYASDILSCPIAAMISFIPKIKVIYHEHDSPGGGSINTPSRFLLFIRKVVGRRAAICIFPNKERMGHFINTVSKRRNYYCVWNCPGISEVRPHPRGGVKDKIIIYYHGNISNRMLPSAIIEALTKLPDYVYLTAVGYETIDSCGYTNYLERIAEKLAVRQRVRFFGAMSRGPLYELCNSADIGFLSVPSDNLCINKQMLIGASNKIFDYLACGLALLVPDKPDWRDMCVEPGYGLSCNTEDPESIASALRWFLEHSEEMRRMGERGRQKILKEWNYEKQFEQVKEKIEKGENAIPSA